MRSRIAACVVATSLLVVGGCTIPHERSDLELTKQAVTSDEVDRIFERYREVRNAAIELLDPKPLSVVESGAVLDIDSGSFQVAQRQQGTRDAVARIDVARVITPSFSRYPLWFLAIVRDREAGVNRIQVFERSNAVEPWLLVASPETLLDVGLPELRSTAGSQALPVKADNGVGMALSPQAAADAYAAALAEPSSPEALLVEEDAFVNQMRESAEQNASLGDVEFAQEWAAEEVRFALRTADGGALVFVDLVRTDTYTVTGGLKVSWPENSPQQAFMQGGITETGSLTYYHQVLLYLPGGSGKPRALGQYGGVVSGEGA